MTRVERRPAARARKSRSSLRRDQTMNAASFATESNIKVVALMSGYQAKNVAGLPTVLVSRGKSTATVSTIEANAITIHGMICTNAKVFSVAILVFFDVIPIHMPNHASASRFATAVIA